MKQIILLVVLTIVAGCDGLEITTEQKPVLPKQEIKCPYPVCPPVDLPQAFRESNYSNGSCMHASLISLLRWQGQYEMAQYWRRNYRGAAGVWDLASISDKLGLKYAWTTKGNTDFLEWCSDSRRGAAIHYFKGHAITFCGYQNNKAVLLDNNNTARYIRVDKAVFIQRWKGYGGRALTVVYSPPPKRPWR